MLKGSDVPRSAIYKDVVEDVVKAKAIVAADYETAVDTARNIATHKHLATSHLKRRGLCHQPVCLENASRLYICTMPRR